MLTDLILSRSWIGSRKSCEFMGAAVLLCPFIILLQMLVLRIFFLFWFSPSLQGKGCDADVPLSLLSLQLLNICNLDTFYSVWKQVSQMKVDVNLYIFQRAVWCFSMSFTRNESNRFSPIPCNFPKHGFNIIFTVWGMSFVLWSGPYIES